MLKTFKKGLLTAAAAVLGAALLGGCSSGTRASDGLVHLNFQIWDNAQRGGMEAIALSLIHISRVLQALQGNFPGKDQAVQIVQNRQLLIGQGSLQGLSLIHI